jgi:hypothetical protein
MPFASKSQQRKFGAMVGRGEIPKSEYKEWASKSRPYSSLPERKKKRGRPPCPK